MEEASAKLWPMRDKKFWQLTNTNLVSMIIKILRLKAVVADAQDEDVLRSLGIRNVDHVIVAIGEDIQASILVTLMVKEQGVKYVTAKAQNEYHAKVLEKLGVDRVVHPERDMGVRIGRSLTSKNMVDYLDLDANFKLAEILITNPEFVGKSLAEMDFRDRYGLNVIALAHSRQEMVLPSAGDVLTENDSILVAGPTRAIDKFEELMQKGK